MARGPSEQSESKSPKSDEDDARDEFMGNEGPGAFGVWLRTERERKGLSQIELARRSGLSNLTLSFIETGRTKNPTRETVSALQKALNVVEAQPTQETNQSGVAADTAVESEAAELRIPELGSLQAFDPYAVDQVPDQPGVYVFYDVSDRPIYVGRSKSVRRRVKTHSDRFWFKAPIVVVGYFLEVQDDKLRNQIEKVLIQFLRSNAVVNQMHVDRDAED